MKSQHNARPPGREEEAGKDQESGRGRVRGGEYKHRELRRRG